MLIWHLIYLTITHPELSYSVLILAQFMHAPRQDHWDATLRVVRYLKGSHGHGILLHTENNLQLSAYCDSDWESCSLTRRSLTGYFVLLEGHPSHGKPRNNIMFLARRLRPNIDSW